MVVCAFCPTDKKELYTCPRCRANYCSVKCYRGKDHATCSENFYKDCVKKELKGKLHDGPGSDTFEERMNQYVRGETDQLPGAGASATEDGGEPIDSDEELEEEDYMKKVVTDTMTEYEQEEDELDRRLIAMGLGGDVEQLMGALSEEERAAFAQLAEEMHQEELGLGQSCFKSSH